MQEKYPWLEPDDKRKNMSCREILDKSCLTDSEKN